MEDGLVLNQRSSIKGENTCVLILVVMEDGLVQCSKWCSNQCCTCLNPCCNGRWSRTILILYVKLLCGVLILVVMEDGLVLMSKELISAEKSRS